MTGDPSLQSASGRILNAHVVLSALVRGKSDARSGTTTKPCSPGLPANDIRFLEKVRCTTAHQGSKVWAGSSESHGADDPMRSRPPGVSPLPTVRVKPALNPPGELTTIIEPPSNATLAIATTAKVPTFFQGFDFILPT